MSGSVPDPCTQTSEIFPELAVTLPATNSNCPPSVSEHKGLGVFVGAGVFVANGKQYPLFWGSVVQPYKQVIGTLAGVLLGLQ